MKTGKFYARKIRGFPLPKRFWARVKKGHKRECWPWIGAQVSAGYGAIIVNGKQESAHRIAWMIENGTIPDGLFVLHHCDNPCCCNPSHLFLGTNRDNIQDCVRKCRNNAPYGSAQHLAKLTDAQAKEIVLRFQAGEMQKDLAREFGLNKVTVWNIVRGHAWTHATNGMIQPTCRHGKAKLTEEAARSLILSKQAGVPLDINKTAAKFCVSTATIHRLLTGFTWKKLHNQLMAVK